MIPYTEGTQPLKPIPAKASWHAFRTPVRPSVDTLPETVSESASPPTKSKNLDFISHGISVGFN